MPFAVFTRVREVSSEDKVHAAENLIGVMSGKKWKTKNYGEKSAYVILELFENQQICGIDIGNEHSAFVEVLVSKGSCDIKDFMEILVTCSFMTPIESKNSTNPHRVRCFNLEALVPSVASEKWSLVKIVCTQPFNKHIQYGLSFIKLHVVDNNFEKTENSTQIGKDITTKPNDLGLTTTKQIGKFNLRQACLDVNEGDDITLFKRWQKCKNFEDSIAKMLPALSSKQIVQDSAGKETEVAPKKPRLSSQDPSPTQKKTQLNHSQQSGTKDMKSENEFNSKVHSSNNGERSKHKPIKLSNTNFEQSNSNFKVTPSPLKYKPFNQLFQGVVFVFSGIQNPKRTELRNKALALGGKYKPDWDHTCTHLVCAFKNTPKHSQVKGKGKIVQPKWISECYNSKKYLPWRRFALDSSDANQIESDEEILDESLKPPNSAKNRQDKKDSLGSKETMKENKSDIISLYDLDDSLETNQEQPKKRKVSTTDFEPDRKLNDSKEQIETSLKYIMFDINLLLKIFDADLNEFQQEDSKDVYEATTDEDDYLLEKMKMCA